MNDTVETPTAPEDALDTAANEKFLEAAAAQIAALNESLDKQLQDVGMSLSMINVIAEDRGIPLPAPYEPQSIDSPHARMMAAKAKAKKKSRTRTAI